MSVFIRGTFGLCLIAVALASGGAAFGEGGVHVGGNGGGFVEMQAVYFHQELATILRPCVMPDSPCGMEPEAREDFLSLLREHERETHAIPLRFAVRLPGDAPFETERRWQAAISIATAALYNSDGSAKPSAEVAAVVLAARWSHANTNRTLSNLHQRARALMATLQVHHVAAHVVPSDIELEIHDFITYLNGAVSRHAIFAEDRQSTYDISAMIAARLDCGTLDDWAFQNWEGARYPGVVVFRARARSSCGVGPSILEVTIPVGETGLMRPQETLVALKPEW